MFANMNRDQGKNANRLCLLPESELTHLLYLAVENSPISTWIADSNGTLVYENRANRELFGIERDDEVVGKYNILKDEELIRKGLLPQIRRIFEEGGSTEFIIDYDFAQVRHVTVARPTHKILRVFIFAILDEQKRVQYVFVQHEDYTEKWRTERELQASQQRYRELVEEVSDWVWAVDAAGRYTYSSPVVERVLGYKPEEVIGTSIFDLINPDDRKKCEEEFHKIAAEGKEIVRCLNRNLRKDGSVVWLETNGKPIYDETGKLIGFRGISRDVTERVRIEEALRYHAEFDRIITRLSTNFINLPLDQIDDGINEALRVIGEFTGADRSYIFLFRDNLQRMDNTHEWTAPGIRSFRGRLINLATKDFPWFMERMLRQEVVYAPQVEDLPPEASAEKAEFQFEDIKSLVNVPMVYRGNLVGFLGFDSVSAKKAWAEDIIALLRIVGEIFVNALERKRAEEALHESESQYRLLVQMMIEGLAKVDRDYVFTYVNDALCTMLGYSRDELLGHSILEFIHEDFLSLMHEQIAKRKRGESGKYETAWKAKDGRKVYTLISPRPILDEKGEFTGSIAVLTDITEREQAEEALRRSEARFRTIIDTAPALILAYDREGIIRQVNPAFEEFTGYSREELLNRSMFDTFAPLELTGPQNEVTNKVFSGETVTGQEWYIKRSDDTAGYALVNTTPLYGEDGRVELALAIGVDVTDRKLAEARRRELEAHKRDFYRRTILAATEGKLVITDRSEVFQIAGPAIETWHIADGADLGKVRNAIAEIAEAAGMDEDRIYDFVLAVGEATTNALKHARGGAASLHKKDDSFIFMMNDNGPGIEALTLPEVALKRGYTTAESLGMGYKAMISIADKVYLATGPEGTTVAIEMALTAPAAPTGIPDTWAKLELST